jgi:transcriptional regulator
MYAPAAFAITDPAELAAAMARAPLATLVVSTGQGLEAAHLPMLHDAEAGTLVGHLARQNPVAALADGPAMAIFGAASAYVSPSFYPSKAEHGRVVPTWNYETVHVHGRLERFDDPDHLRAVVAALTDRFEADRPTPWSVDDAPEVYVAGMLGAIVGVRLVIERMEGVRKLSQNRSASDKAGVREGLAASPLPGDRSVAALMKDDLHG